jgi:long-chain acyl-CoA synthetase
LTCTSVDSLAPLTLHVWTAIRRTKIAIIEFKYLLGNTMPWFHRAELLERWLADFITDHMRQLRPQYNPPAAFIASINLNRHDADIDSIELVELASALYLALDAEDSGALNEYAQQHGNLGGSFADWTKFAGFAARKTSALWFQSSGSTGKRRWIRHELAHLQAEVREVAAIAQANNQAIQRVVSIMPAHHVYGFLFGALLPAMLEVPALHVRGAAPAMLRAQLKPGDLLIAHPSFWNSALSVDRLGTGKALFPTNVMGFSSGQALPGALFEALQHAGLTRLIELYGATETAGIGWRDSGGGFALLSRYRWAKASGNELTDSLASCESCVQLPDAIARQRNDRFSVQGRLDRVVQIAGQNVHLDAIEARLSSFPGVTMARLRKMPATDPNARLHAFIVSSQPLDSAKLRAFAEAQLQTAELPQSYTFGAELPKTAAGKECEWALG